MTRVVRGAATSMALGIVATLGAGCVPLGTSAHNPFHPESAYIYGRFLMRTDDHLEAAFSIRCRDRKRYKIWFSKDAPVRMIRIPPGVCQLDEIIYGSGGPRDMAGLRLLGNEHLEAGGVYYVGDFVMAGHTTGMEATWGGITVHQFWALFSPRNNYASTTAELKRLFPDFAPVATEDRMPRQ